ncbi:MAG: hypothetical protein EG823_05520 [Actinobacteria bacterium]|nr:hypothetical protein [Actinomycetota bacterium]
MILDRHGEPFRVRAALFWAVSWGAGAAVGVALGGWLTLAGGSGAPGAEGLDPIVDLICLPAGAFGVVAIVHLGGQLIAAALRGRAEAGRKQENDGERAEGDGVAGQVG